MELAASQPEDPRRIFGQAVEAAPGSSGDAGEQLSRMCTDVVARALPVVVDRLIAHIDEHLAHLEGRQRVNLNVRAPKRSSPHNAPIARNIVGRPFPARTFPRREGTRGRHLARSAEELRTGVRHGCSSPQEEEVARGWCAAHIRGAEPPGTIAVHRGRPRAHGRSVAADESTSRGSSGAPRQPARGCSCWAKETNCDGHASCARVSKTVRIWGLPS